MTGAEYASNVAQLYTEHARAMSEAARARGQVWGQTLASIGQIPERIQQQQAQQQNQQIRGNQVQMQGL